MVDIRGADILYFHWVQPDAALGSHEKDGREEILLYKYYSHQIPVCEKDLGM